MTKPLLLISAKDGPFLGFTATQNDVSDKITILETEHGGHVGFIRYNSKRSKVNDHKFDINWLPEAVVAYFRYLFK